MSEWAIKTLRKLADFQAEYEGSIPFTRSNSFNALSPSPILIPTNAAALVPARIPILQIPRLQGTPRTEVVAFTDSAGVVDGPFVHHFQRTVDGETAQSAKTRFNPCENFPT
jgi:hypothetical protein